MIILFLENISQNNGVRDCLCVKFETFGQQLLSSRHLFKFNNRNTRTTSEICAKLTLKTTEQRH